MDVTSLFSGIMIGAGLGLAFCVAIIYVHHREVITDEGESDLLEAKLAEDLTDDLREELRETNRVRQ
jgi:hypothetical protein